MRFIFIWLFALAGLCAACSRQQQTAETNALDTAAWKAELIQYRQAQDSFLRTNPESPLRNLPFAKRQVTRFDPDASYRVQAVLDRMPRREPWLLATSTGESRRMLRLGYLVFQLKGQNCRLAAFAYEEDPKGLFVPFLDSTGGSETYKAGRYLDLRDDGSGKVWIDFNRAYHPHCAYNADYSCPLVPAENRLPLYIRAGESLPPHTSEWE
jgi:uncharacterized protein (DUF1684 family)